jgi:hypothetical protein
MSKKCREVHQLTEYDTFADKALIADRVTFLSNIKAIINYDNKYKDVFKDIIEMSNTPVTLNRNLGYNEFLNDMQRIYDCNDNYSISAIYNVICTDYKMQKQEYTDYNEMRKVIYNAYNSDYNTFVMLLHKALEEPNKWFIREKIKNKSNKQEDLLDTIKLPSTPNVPM